MDKRILARCLIGLLLGGLLSGCGQMQPVGSRSQMIEHRVESGDTLYSIAWRYGYNPRTVAAWNNIPSPYTIHPGQRILIIPPHQQNARNTPPAEQASVTHRSPVTSALATSSRPARVATSSTPRKKVENTPSRLQNKDIRWSWPTAGKVLTPFALAKGKKGMDIGGKLGQPVTAAADGTVVYSGSGLIGYGNLIIIKHNDTYLSAYGHNRRLLAKEGDMVKQGRKIAEMGDSGKRGVMLHFEIRRDGNPVNPMRYLPEQGS
ncbi:MAG: peptidoglycan DD-metalloendopeptidase family protein [Gammaproteobacteria bacterium]|nr:peptidoglycan DD-metalloendopeptidase family protein [Gammaproteobacteria bacterium]